MQTLKYAIGYIGLLFAVLLVISGFGAVIDANDWVFTRSQSGPLLYFIAACVAGLILALLVLSNQDE